MQPTIAVDVLFACQNREKGAKNPIKITTTTALEDDAQKFGKDVGAFPAVATLDVTDKGKEPDTPNSTNPPSTGNTPRSDTTPPLEVSTSGKTLTKKEHEKLKKDEEKRKKEEDEKKKKEDEKKKKEDEKKKKNDKKTKN